MMAHLGCRLAQTFLASNASYGSFGKVVGMSAAGSRIIISDPEDYNGPGRVYVLYYNGSAWVDVYQTDLTGTSGVEFGSAVGISSDGLRIIIKRFNYG